MFFGDVTNNIVLAKIKVAMGGKWLWVRTISSTVLGQFVNTTIFYVVALSGILPANFLIQAILAGWVIKTVVEVLMTPVTYLVVRWVKKVEHTDHYDQDTNFNPFIIRPRM